MDEKTSGAWYDMQARGTYGTQAVGSIAPMECVLYLREVPRVRKTLQLL